MGVIQALICATYSEQEVHSRMHTLKRHRSLSKWILLALALLLVAAPAWAAIAELSAQRAQQFVTTGSSTTVAYPNNVAANSLLAACGQVFDDPLPSTISVTDTRGTSYSIVYFTTLGARGFIAYGIAPSSGANTVTIDPSSGVDNLIGVGITEFTGVDTSTPLDVDGGTSTGTSTTPSDSITTGVANALILGCLNVEFSAATITPGGSYTQIAEVENQENVQYSFVLRIVTAAQAYTVDWTLGLSKLWEVYTLSFKSSSEGCRPNQGRRLLLGVGC